MTVDELIEVLNQLPGNIEVYFSEKVVESNMPYKFLSIDNLQQVEIQGEENIAVISTGFKKPEIFNN